MVNSALRGRNGAVRQASSRNVTLPRRPFPRFVPPHRLHAAAAGFWPRLLAVAALTVFAYFFVFTHVIAEILAGSRTAFLVTVPALSMLIAYGHRIPPRGVGDDESDWIVALFGGIAAMVAIHLMARRLPTLSGLWHLQYVGIVCWVACVATVLFGVRHVLRSWQVWLFALCTATPLPYLLVLAQCGGSNTAAAVSAAAFGALAVFLGGRHASIQGRLAATAGSLAIGACLGALLADRLPMWVAVLVAGGVVPVAHAVALERLRRTDSRRGPDPRAIYLPRRPPLAWLTLAIVAAALLAANLPSAPEPLTPQARPDWVERAGLRAGATYPFIDRFLGPGATLKRYRLPPVVGQPVAAVDVITIGNRAALRDFADAVWYPSPTPTNQVAIDLGNPAITGARALGSDADAASDSRVRNWYAITWQWRVPDGYQQISVVVNQAQRSTDEPAPPQPMSIGDVLVGPATWISRQQPLAAGFVAEPVSDRALAVVRKVLDAGTPHD